VTPAPSAPAPDGALRYRVDQTGATIAVLPATCKGGRHIIVPGVSRAISAGDEVRVHCPACAATPGVDASWRLTSKRPSSDRAELDDEAYRDLFSRPADAPRHVIVTGLDLTGVVPGRLHGRFPSVEGDWYGIVNYEIDYADGRRDKLHLVDQFVPFTALRERK
jgi:hypothetical protein